MNPKPTIGEVRRHLLTMAKRVEYLRDHFPGSRLDRAKDASIYRRALELLPNREPRGVTIIYNVSKRRKRK